MECTDCIEVAARLHLYIDRELSVEEVAIVQQHLTSCPGCRCRFHVDMSIKQLIHERCAWLICQGECWLRWTLNWKWRLGPILKGMTRYYMPNTRSKSNLSCARASISPMAKKRARLKNGNKSR
jgi:putative zinc finger protein